MGERREEDVKLLQTAKREGGEGGGVPGTGAEIPMQPVDRATPEQTRTLQPVEDSCWSRGKL